MWIRKRTQGEITAFLAILFVLMAGFICSVAEVASIHEEKCYRRTDMDLSMYSVFGEYQKDLLEKYHVFGLDAGYESGNYSEDAVLGRLRYYGAEEMDLEMTDVQFLTDNSGAAFYEQVLFYMETKYGINLIREFTGLTSEWEEQMVQGEEFLEEKDSAVSRLLQSLENNSETDSASQNAGMAGVASSGEQLEDSLMNLQDTSSSAFLKKVLPENFTLSAKAFDLEKMPSRRSLNRGFGSFQQRDTSGLVSRLLFGEYVLQNFSNACEDKESGGMAYEVEYVIAGKKSDKENLEAVAKRLAIFRFTVNYIYLQTDSTKLAEAESVALTISSVLLLPEIKEIVKQAILLLWAYQESLEDVKTLLSGGKVPFTKTLDTWQSSIDLNGSGTELVVSDNDGSRETDASDSSGMDYEDYLRILLFLTNKEKCTMRSLDVIEYGLQAGAGLNFFRVDLCISKMRIKSTAELRQGITYDFLTEFIYE